MGCSRSIDLNMEGRVAPGVPTSEFPVNFFAQPLHRKAGSPRNLWVGDNFRVVLPTHNMFVFKVGTPPGGGGVGTLFFIPISDPHFGPPRTISYVLVLFLILF